MRKLTRLARDASRNEAKARRVSRPTIVWTGTPGCLDGTGKQRRHFEEWNDNDCRPDERPATRRWDAIGDC